MAARQRSLGAGIWEIMCTFDYLTVSFKIVMVISRNCLWNRLVTIRGNCDHTTASGQFVNGTNLSEMGDLRVRRGFRCAWSWIMTVRPWCVWKRWDLLTLRASFCHRCDETCCNGLRYAEMKLKRGLHTKAWCHSVLLSMLRRNSKPLGFAPPREEHIQQVAVSEQPQQDL